MKQEPMRSSCAGCGDTVFSDSDAVEMGLKYWESELTPFKHIRILCWLCFAESTLVESLMDALNLRNEWEVMLPILRKAKATPTKK